MQQRLSIITLGVSNLERAKHFYEALGWQIADKNNPNIIAFNLHQMALALYPKEKLAKDAGVSFDETRYSNFTLAYNVNSELEVNSTLVEAERAGATIIKPAEKAFWGGYSGYFSDLDNFLWEVAYNPFSKLEPNGAFQWGAG